MGIAFAKAESPPIVYLADDNQDGNDDDEDLLNIQKPAHVNTVHIDGLSRTKNDLVTKQLERLFECTTFDDIVAEAHNGKLKLERIGIFNDINVFIDVNRVNQDKKEDYDVYYFIKEKRRISAQAGTNVGHNEGNMVLGARLNNIRGLGESVNANVSYGTKQSNSYEFSCSKPLLNDPDKKVRVRVLRSLAELTQSFYKEDSKGAGVDITIPSQFGVHTLSWDYIWRSNLISDAAPFDIREHAGHSLKSAVKHSLTSDGRDDWIFPSKGHIFKHNIEYSGIGGNVKALKTDLEIQLNKELFKDIVVSGSLHTGVARSLTSDPLLINDRCFLGGPLSVRGYAMKGIGQHSNQASLGGEVFWASGVHLYTPLPFRPGKGGFGDLFRLHFFANAGNISNINSLNSKDFMSKPRYSYGLGVMFMLGGMARLEVNYCIPKNARHGDIINDGLQVGVGLNFL